MAGDESAWHQERAGGGEGVEAFPRHPVGADGRPVFAPGEVAAGHIIGGHEAGHMVHRLGGGNVPAGAADHHRHLRFPIDVVHTRRQHDVVIGAGQAVGRLEKGVGAQLRTVFLRLRVLCLVVVAAGEIAGAHFFDVLAIICRRVEHLGRPQHRRQHRQVC